MTYAQTLKRASSTCLVGKADLEAFKALKTAGIDAVELSFNFDTYMNKMDFARNWQKYVDYAKEAGIELWSIHLPFSRSLDISTTNNEFRAVTLYTNRTLIEAAGKAGIKVAVLHPSSEPITAEDRPERMRRSREAIIMLKDECDKAGMKLAVENLPRTCLCNRSAEMIELLKDTGAGIVFDTNHSLAEENVAFLTALVDSGIPIYTMHISDYDFVDERHRLPGDGINNWKGIFEQLERAGYNGPMLYEVPTQPKDRDAITPEQEVANMIALAAGEI